MRMKTMAVLMKYGDDDSSRRRQVLDYYLKSLDGCLHEECVWDDGGLKGESGCLYVSTWLACCIAQLSYLRPD